MTKKTSPRIYCSGPLFSPEEVGAMQAIADTLEDQGMETFLPHRDGLESWVMPLADMPLQGLVPAVRRRIDQAIFALDIYQLAEECDAIVVNLNGRVPDEGAIVEASVAWSLGKPVVFYKHDHRGPFGGYDNAMVTGLTRGETVASIRNLPSALKKACRKKVSAVEPTPEMARTLKAGGRIWQILKRVPVSPGSGLSRQVLDRILEVVEKVQP